MKVIGITGSLACGKSAVAELFAKWGAQVVDADRLAASLTRKGTPTYRAIVKIFGAGILQKNKQLDRRKLAQHVFSHPKDLKKLNVLIHPNVILETYKMIAKTKNKKGLLVLDVPLLFESKMEKLVEKVIVVQAKPGVILRRAAARGIPTELAQKILASQWSSARKAKLADHVIQNNGTLGDLEAQAKKIFELIK
jgi:dephospho-CoA kinase